MTILYGIKQCDTVKKARQWLDAHAVSYRFHDFRVDGLDASQIAGWIRAVGWETLVNRRGTTWRNLDEQTRAQLNGASAIATLLAQPTLIKRPVLDHRGSTSVGFDPRHYQQLLQSSNSCNPVTPPAHNE
ncbi:MAG: ArsC family reductase [Porticoccaceae bacterium]